MGYALAALGGFFLGFPVAYVTIAILLKRAR